ncbi:MAG: polysulfide reductase NrfD [Eggerthellaceae bacterium]|nr:polysulfide reductase NrfD [Eggerthellaceae bacterium]
MEKKLSALKIAGIVGAVVAVIGIIFWIKQLSGGMVQTGMRNYDSWGLYITNFMFFVGLSAGGLIISSIPKAFGMKGFGDISKIAVWTAICCTVAAIGFVIVDLGGPTRIWELFVYSNLSSPLMWDIIVLMVYLVLSIILLWAMYGEEKGKVSHTALRVLSVISLITAVLVHTVTAWIFGLQPSHELWYTALLGPWFVSSALVCGTALVMVVVIALRAAGRIELEQANIVKMAKLLGAFICVDLYFFACDLLTSGFPQGGGAELVKMLVSGPLAAFFWLEVIGCIIAAIICFVPSLRKNGLLVAAGVLAILGIFCKRVQLLVGGFQNPNIDMAIPNATFATAPNATGALIYWPTGIEWMVTLGVIGLAAALLCFGLDRICKK